jgi:putative transposase
MEKIGVYHVFNRGVDKRDIFLSPLYYNRFLECLFEFNDVEPVKSIWYRRSCGEEIDYKNRECLVNIHAYCLLPNHFHLILEELVKNGIAEFMKRLGGGYTNFFNVKNERNGALFQGNYKRILIDSHKYLYHCYAYVAANIEIHGIAKVKDWPWTSLSKNEKFSIYNQNNVLKDLNLLADKSIDLYLNEIIELAKHNKEFQKQLIDFDFC